MPLSLHVDGVTWRSHLSAIVKAKPGLVPVIKGNGYGFGLEFLATESTLLGVDTIAVGLASEVAQVRTTFAGEVIILSPDHLHYDISDPKIIQTISHLEVLRSIDAKKNIILEILTPLNRHGVEVSDLPKALSMIEDRRLQLRGFALHLPLAKIERGWLRSVLHMLPAGSTVWISHLHNADRVRKEFPQLVFRERIGTSLWLGAESALEARATVLENRKIQGTVGYRQRRVRANVIVASGGTAHGIGMTAPQGDFSILGRIKILARAVELSFGRIRSPFRWDGKLLDFLEPPHMQCSLLTCSGNSQPQVGDELKVRVRHTTTIFDQIIVR
jgi:Alanine racemase, N-terminal domain